MPRFASRARRCHPRHFPDLLLSPGFGPPLLPSPPVSQPACVGRCCASCAPWAAASMAPASSSCSSAAAWPEVRERGAGRPAAALPAPARLSARLSAWVCSIAESRWRDRRAQGGPVRAPAGVGRAAAVEAATVGSLPVQSPHSLSCSCTLPCLQMRTARRSRSTAGEWGCAVGGRWGRCACSSVFPPPAASPLDHPSPLPPAPRCSQGGAHQHRGMEGARPQELIRSCRRAAAACLPPAVSPLHGRRRRRIVPLLTVSLPSGTVWDCSRSTSSSRCSVAGASASTPQ